jgi:putative nucleotidyltransferase with HDIG domain
MIELELALTEVLSHEDPAIPVSAPIAAAIAALARGGDLRIDDLERLAFADPAIAAELLAVANAGGGEIASLPEAAAAVGHGRFLRIVRAVTEKGAPTAAGPLAPLRHRAWRVSVISALVCRELARARGLPAEEAYACGLFHDVGEVAAIAAVERLAAGTRPSRALPLWRWERLADRWHLALGAAFAERRHFPRSIVDVIASHHAERAAPGEPSPLAQVVRSVDALIAVFANGCDPIEAVESADLRDDEADRLARALEAADSHVEALARHAPGASGRTVGAPARALHEPALHEPKGWGVRLRLAGREYTAVGFGAHQLLVSGPAPLGEGAMLEIEVLDRNRSAFHARVLAAWAEGDRFGAILVPFGLSGRWLADFGGVLPAGARA